MGVLSPNKPPRAFQAVLPDVPLASPSRFGYGSIPIHTIFSGMNIHLPAILMFTRGTRFWHTAIWFQLSNYCFRKIAFCPSINFNFSAPMSQTLEAQAGCACNESVWNLLREGKRRILWFSFPCFLWGHQMRTLEFLVSRDSCSEDEQTFLSLPDWPSGDMMNRAAVVFLISPIAGWITQAALESLAALKTRSAWSLFLQIQKLSPGGHGGPKTHRIHVWYIC